LFERGQVARVPYIAGFNSYDGGGTLMGAGFNAASFEALFANPAVLRALYRNDYTVSADQGAQRGFGDRRYGVSALESVRAMARFSPSAQIFYLDEYGANEPGAGHGSHVRPMFVDSQGPLRTYFLNFIKTGSTNDDNLPKWPRWQGTQRQWLVMRGQPLVVRDPLHGRLEKLNALARAPDGQLNTEANR
jgi:para-nitrobenzyl esterase